MKFVLFQSVANVVFEMNVENVFVVTSSPFTASAFEVEADVFGIQIEKVKKKGMSWGRIFSRVRPFYDRAVSKLDRSMYRSLRV